MKQRCFSKGFPIVLCLFIAVLCSSVCGAQEKPFADGAQFPQITLPAPDSPQTQAYLGLKTMEPCTISSFGAKMIILEFVSAMCPHCHTNAPIVNRLYKVIQDDASLSKDVKIVGVCIGNNKTQVDAFKKNFKVPFPIFPDESLTIAASAEVMATPTMVVLTRDGKVLTSHVGVIEDFDGFLKQLREYHKKL